MLPVSLDFPFLIAPSVFSNIYLHQYTYIVIYYLTEAKMSVLSLVACPWSVVPPLKLVAMI
jgi:hypothetical protein